MWSFQAEQSWQEAAHRWLDHSKLLFGSFQASLPALSVVRVGMLSASLSAVCCRLFPNELWMIKVNLDLVYLGHRGVSEIRMCVGCGCSINGKQLSFADLRPLS